MQERYEGKLVVIGVTATGADEARAFAREHGATYPILADADESRKVYGVKVIWGSAAYLIDPQGKIVADRF
ncbi:MAG: peroxiredoxin family protein, partial [Planctomycetota bacterium]